MLPLFQLFVLQDQPRRARSFLLQWCPPRRAPQSRLRSRMVLRGQDAWRRHPIFRWKFTDAFPGMREGAALFALYVGYDKFLAPKEEEGHHGHGSAHGGSHGAHGEAAVQPHH
jgi:hypothetical protein